MKKKTFLKYSLAAVFTTAVVALATGCLFSPPGAETGGEAHEPTEPKYVLQNIALSYNQRDTDLYKKSLSPNFIFYFNPLDVGEEVGGYKIPVSCNYEEDWHATKNMFEQAESISLSIPIDKVGTPLPEADTHRADNISIYLLIYQTPDSGYKVETGYCNFEFEKYYDGGKAYWRVVRWWDFTTAPG
jgi:hypothetical protein